MNSLAEKKNSGILIVSATGLYKPHSMPGLVRELISQLDFGNRIIRVLGNSSYSAHGISASVPFVQSNNFLNEDLDSLLKDVDDVIYSGPALVKNTQSECSNVDFFQNLLQISHILKKIAESNKRIIYLSAGSAIYGQSLEPLINESHQTSPLFDYGIGLLTIENKIQLCSKTHKLKHIILRQSNVYGVGQKPFLGQGFIPTAIGSVLNGESIKLMGSGDAIRDYLFLSDLVSGIVSIINAKNLIGIFNIGSSVGRSNLEVVNTIVSIMKDVGVDVAIEKVPVKGVEIMRNILDASKLTAATGWKPKVDFLTGMKITRDWLMGESI